METDILKPDTGVLSIERPMHATSKGSSSSDRPESSGHATPEFTREPYAEPVSEGEEDEEMGLAPAHDEGKITGLTGPEVAAAVAFREKLLKERAQEPASSPPSSAPVQNGIRARDMAADSDADDDDDDEGQGASERTPFLKARRGRQNVPGDATLKARALSIDPLAPSSAFDETLRDRLREDQERQKGKSSDDDEEEGEDGTGEGVGDGRLLERNWRAPPGKRIAVPVRIEPKVYFATERTFLVSYFLHLFSFSSCQILIAHRYLEMAQLRHLHRNHRHHAPQLRPA